MGEKDIQIKDNISLSEAGLFHNNPDLIFIFKKTQKISYAIFMLSDLLDPQEPLRLSLRTSASSLIKAALSIGKNSRSDRMVAFESLIAFLFESLSFCEAGLFSRLISEMNFNILKKEILDLAGFADSKMDKRIVLEENFLDTQKDVFYKGQAELVKGHNKVENVLYKDKKELKKETRSQRSESILSLLKGGKEFTIKDFSASISGCSEKTIQRELLSLVAKGQLKKRGERRWSKYSLL